MALSIPGLLRDRVPTPADVVVSDDPGSSRKIAEFAANDRPWLVSVRMVSVRLRSSVESRCLTRCPR